MRGFALTDQRTMHCHGGAFQTGEGVFAEPPWQQPLQEDDPVSHVLASDFTSSFPSSHALAHINLGLSLQLRQRLCQRSR